MSPHELIMGMVFHVLSGGGTLAQHVNELTGIDISDSALSPRRGNLDWRIFEAVMATALKPRADATQHPEAFYQGLLLCGVDGSQFSVANTPQVKAQMKKAKSGRRSAAFAKVGVGVLVELGIHNPIAAAIGTNGQSEMVFAEQVLAHLPDKSLLIADRYYGMGKVIGLIQKLHPSGQREYLLRVRSNIKGRVLEAYGDGSALIEAQTQGRKLRVREIQARVRVGKGAWSTVRLWTSLMDWRKHSAQTLVALYARRWEQEGFYRELKVDMRSADLVQSHTPKTAAQEIAALLVAYSILVEERLKVASMGEVEVVRISFMKVMQTVSGLWQFLELTQEMLTDRQTAKVVSKAHSEICAGQATQEILPARATTTGKRLAPTHPQHLQRRAPAIRNPDIRPPVALTALGLVDLRASLVCHQPQCGPGQNTQAALDRLRSRGLARGRQDSVGGHHPS